jgi:hypothetical protein
MNRSTRIAYRFLVTALLAAAPAPAADSAKVLSGLVCPQGQIAKNDGTQWVCADDENDDTLGGLVCAEGEVAKFVGGNWACAADDDTANTDTLADLDCTTDQIAAFNGTAWECADLPAQPDQSNLVFLTSRAYRGESIGGIVGADAKCSELANAAGLYGRFMAWLSDAKRPLPSPNQLQDLDLDVAQFDFATSPMERFERSPWPYLRTDGTRIADDWFDLTTCDEGPGDQCLDAAIVFDETGARVPGTEAGSAVSVWSSTGPDGAIGILGFDRTGGTCNDWEPELDLADANLAPFGLAGDDVLDEDWTNRPGSGDPCNAEKRLYCVQQ